MSKIGLVTVLYKSDDVLEDFFSSVASQAYKNYILYIIDNSPTKESEILVTNYIKQHALENQTIYLPSAGNIGVAAGNNVGIKAALKDKCDFVLLSNNDILIKDVNLFSTLIDEFENKKIQIIIPKIYFYNSKDFWFITGYFNKFRAKCFHQYNYETDNGQFNNLTYCDYAPTCFMLFKSEVFDKVGLMDEKYFVYYDDTDFLWRCKTNKIKVYLCTKTFIEHKEGRSTGGNTSDFSYYYFTRNRFYFSNKINKNIFIKTLSIIYIFNVSLLRAIKHKKIKIYHKILNDFYNKRAFLHKSN